MIHSVLLLALLQPAADPAAPKFDPTDATKWGEPPTVNGLKDWTLPFRRCIKAAGEHAARTKAVATIEIPAGTFGVCPQADDKIPIWRRAFALPSRVTLKGQGPDKTKILFYCEGMTDPKTTWVTTQDGYVKISRGRVFDISSRPNEGGAKRDITIRDLSVNGQAGYTGSFVVGGDRKTGDGWDMTHKCIAADGNQEIDNILLDNVVMAEFRGEIVYSGGGVKRLRAVKSKFWGSNGSCVSCSADFSMEDCEIGGDAPEKQVYNGTENQAVMPYQKSVYKRVKVQCRHGKKDDGKYVRGGNGLVNINIPKTSMLAEDCEFRQCSFGILFTDGAHNITVRRAKFVECNQASITSFIKKGVSNLTYEECELATGALLVSQSSGPKFPNDWGTLQFNRNKIGPTASIVSGPMFGTVQSFVCEGNVFANGGKPGGGAGNIAPLWKDSEFSPEANRKYSSSPAVDLFNLKEEVVAVPVHPFGERLWLGAHNAAKGFDHETAIAVLDTAKNKYPVGFTTELRVGQGGWVLEANASTEWAENLPVPKDKPLTLRVNAKNKFEVVDKK